MALDVLLVSDEMIKDRTSMHGNIDPKLIYPDIKVAQDMYIHPCLGTALFNKLQTLITSGGISIGGNADYKNLVDKYIVDALIYFTLSELPTTISYQFWNKGVIRKQGTDTELPSMSDLIDISNKYKQRAEFYLNRLRLYLREHASASLFPEYLNPGNGLDDMQPEHKSFTMPLYLGDDSDCKRSYEEKYQGDKPNC
jgi:hypothetical protein